MFDILKLAARIILRGDVIPILQSIIFHPALLFFFLPFVGDGGRDDGLESQSARLRKIGPGRAEPVGCNKATLKLINN